MFEKSFLQIATHILQKAFYPIHSKVKVYFLLFKTFRTIIQMRMVTTISGSVFPTGISILIKIRYSTNPITQITAFVMSTDSLRLSARFSRKKSAIYYSVQESARDGLSYKSKKGLPFPGSPFLFISVYFCLYLLISVYSSVSSSVTSTTVSRASGSG